MPALLKLVRDWDGFKTGCFYDFLGLGVTQHRNDMTATTQCRSQSENGWGVTTAALTYHRKDTFSVGFRLQIEHAVNLGC
jgi:hypothetical protein